MIVNPQAFLQQASIRTLVRALENGLPLSTRPYKDLGDRLGISEQQVIDEISLLQELGIIKRMGVVVRHRKLGYRANAMVVWDIPDELVSEIGCFLGEMSCITLSYRRPRRLPQWPYNLFTMIHAASRQEVQETIGQLIETYALKRFNHAILFSKTCYKQCGAHYIHSSMHNEATK